MPHFMTMTPIPSASTRTDVHSIAIEGADAIAFAQSQFSSDVGSLQSGAWQFSAWLDPQGRVRSLFHLARLSDDRLLLILRGGDATDMSNALRRFVFRSKVSITPRTGLTLTDAPALPVHTLAFEDEDLVLGCGDHSVRLSAMREGDSSWRLLQVRAGWPWLPDALQGALLAPSLSLMRLQAASLDKGCYPGQEIVARLHYRGGNKRHMHSVVLSQWTACGTILKTADDVTIQLLNVATGDAAVEALAVIPDDASHNASDSLISHNGLSIEIRKTWDA
jgi:folate-binding protein YgfZ